ncbi:MAG: hypothetical protein D6746_10885 [Bacteroidetes bacterium]|nr:MAG: hypothetical protein D6746_10885 [Bacteroidota bacterium]
MKVIYFLWGKLMKRLYGQQVVRRFILGQEPQNAVEEFWFERAHACPQCLNNGSCLECGCDVVAMFFTTKPCRGWKRRSS